MLYFNKNYFDLIDFLFIVSNMIGDATNKEEYVPTITPIISANINPLIRLSSK